VGNLSALRQESVKRILAYSSISHAGYMLMAAAILVRPVEAGTTHIGLSAVVAYLFVYLIMNLGAFGVTAMVAWQSGTDHLSAFTGLGRRAPWLAIPMTVCLFSLVGLPPLGGFAAKWWLLVALGTAAIQEQSWLWALVLVAVVNTAVSLYYYVGIIKQMYLTDDAEQPSVQAPITGLAMVNICSVALLLLGTVLFGRLGAKANDFASDLFDGPQASTLTVSTPTEEIANHAVKSEPQVAGEPLVSTGHQP
jgi:NADH-quinone oxidoreductase subunit N